MKVQLIPIVLLSVALSVTCVNSGKEKGSSIVFQNNEAEKRLEVIMDGKLFTAFCWPDDVYKPILYPVNTSAGTTVTRGFPLNPREGERNDHIHQAGIWLNYGNVNGYDFWGNGHRGVKEPEGGVIKHLRIDKIVGGTGTGSFVSVESWLDPGGKEIVSEETEYHFTAKGSIRIIDRITTLTAGDTAVLFKDTKEGMFGIRVARQLELPSDEGVTLLDAMGNPSAEKDSSNEGVSGDYRSSEGVTGLSVWGTRAKWMDLFGVIGNEKISIVVCDHPLNPGYPTYWHARGYGLFSANPLGWTDFTKGNEVLNFTIPAKKSATFRYRIIISSGVYLTDSEINLYMDNFSKEYK
ncbi:MAG TPA: PmoA family protein [Bacteroidales bacterium]|nr:PmoA family protein [Bacteroidales bacterium]